MRKNKIKYLLIIISLIGLFQSCVKDIDIDLDSFESKLVLNAVVSTEQLWFVNLAKSGNILSSTDTIASIEYADVLVHDLTTNEMMKLKNMGNGNYQHPSIKPIAGHHYRVKASYKDYLSITASTIVPDNVEIIKKDSIQISTDENGKESWTIDFELIETNVVPHFYIIEFYKVDTDSSNTDGKLVKSDNVTLFSSNTDLEIPTRVTSSGSRFFVEKDGKNKIFTTILSKIDDGGGSGESSTGNGPQYGVIVRSVTKSYFDYFQSIEERGEKKNNINSSQTQPSTLYSNVENGFGVLCSFNTQDFSL